MNGNYSKIQSLSMTNKCIVLDLDLTLLCTQKTMSGLYNLGLLTDPKYIKMRNRVYYFKIEDSEIWGITRPHLEEFLIFCFSYFKIVAVWSAGQKTYVESIVDFIFKDLPKPHIIFTRDDTLFSSEDMNNTQTYKPLENIIKSNPVIQKYMKFTNTLAVDDNSSTFYYNKKNGILIPPYEPSETISAILKDDPTLLQLKYWLLQPEIIRSEDVTTLDLTKIFANSLNSYKKNLVGVSGYNFIAN